MSAAATAIGDSRIARLYRSTVGKKAIMAVTGVVLFGFVLGHMAGNLQFFLGPEVLNQYGHKLRELGPLLWVVRLVLLGTVALHITAALQLWLMNRAARPERYAKLTATTSTYASRTMVYSGPVLLAFVIYHLMHLTIGNAHPDFNHDLNVYANVVRGFQQPLVALFYLVAMSLLCLHLYHGVWSMFQSLGLSHPKYTPKIKRFAAAVSLLLLAGFSSVPLAVLAGFHQ